MRLDKYLKISRLIKRRTVAAQACSAGRVEVNGKVVKPAFDIKAGDVINITFGSKRTSIRVLQTPEYVKAEKADSMYEIIESE